VENRDLPVLDQNIQMSASKSPLDDMKFVEPEDKMDLDNNFQVYTRIDDGSD